MVLHRDVLCILMTVSRFLLIILYSGSSNGMSHKELRASWACNDLTLKTFFVPYSSEYVTKKNYFHIYSQNRCTIECFVSQETTKRDDYLVIWSENIFNSCGRLIWCQNHTIDTSTGTCEEKETVGNFYTYCEGNFALLERPNYARGTISLELLDRADECLVRKIHTLDQDDRDQFFKHPNEKSILIVSKSDEGLYLTVIGPLFTGHKNLVPKIKGHDAFFRFR